MVNWKDVRNFIETGEDIQPLPEDTEMYPVVGVSFVPGYPENIYNIRKVMEALQDDVPINLVRNPNNQYDSNAIEVQSLGHMLGHLPREVATKIALQMDAGKQFKATVYQVRISPENPNNPGIDILLREEI